MQWSHEADFDLLVGGGELRRKWEHTTWPSCMVDSLTRPSSSHRRSKSLGPLAGSFSYLVSFPSLLNSNFNSLSAPPGIYLILHSLLALINWLIPAPGGVEKLIAMDDSYDMLQACKNAHHNAAVETHFLVADQEFLPMILFHVTLFCFGLFLLIYWFVCSSVDLVVSCLGLHWTNLPGAMIQVTAFFLF